MRPVRSVRRKALLATTTDKGLVLLGELKLEARLSKSREVELWKANHASTNCRRRAAPVWGSPQCLAGGYLCTHNQQTRTVRMEGAGVLL